METLTDLRDEKEEYAPIYLQRELIPFTKVYGTSRLIMAPYGEVNDEDEYDFKLLGVCFYTEVEGFDLVSKDTAWEGRMIQDSIFSAMSELIDDPTDLDACLDESIKFMQEAKEHYKIIK